MIERLVIGTRGSHLAKTQTELVADWLCTAHPGIEIAVEIIRTRGDDVLDKPLPEIGGKGLFTLELERALREGRIDLAVHSLKDLPTEESEGLIVGAVPQRATPNDALVSTGRRSLPELSDGARVGTSSLRRKAQLLAARPDLRVEDVRGNVETRMRKVAEGKLDAVVLACAGLERIGRMDEAEMLPPELMLPAPAQGALGVQCRADDAATLSLLARIEHPDTRTAVRAERAALAALGGGCHVPLGALARVGGGNVRLEARVVSVDGARALNVSAEGPVQDPERVGTRAAQELIDSGANVIIADVSAATSNG